MKNYRQAVSALVVRPRGEEYEILLVHKPRKHDAWQIPQGGVEQGETPMQAALRELQEETGLMFHHVALQSRQTYCYDFPRSFLMKHRPVHDGQTLCFVVLQADDTAEVRVDRHEIDDFLWVAPLELHRYIERPAYREVICEVFREFLASRGDSSAVC